MLKMFNPDQIRKADAYTIANEPIASFELMERAGEQCFLRILDRFPFAERFCVVCGIGNNGGDGLVIARLLALSGRDVKVFVAGEPKKGSEDFNIMFKCLQKECSSHLLQIVTQYLPEFDGDDILLIDALFGSGLNRPLDGINALLVQDINRKNFQVVSIDIPSGLYAEKGLPDTKAVAVRADLTLSLQFPKLCMMLPDNEEYVGEMEIVSIGLHPNYIRETETDFYLIENSDIAPLFKPRKKFSHKGVYGHALLFAGQYGRMGASVLAARSAMRSGLGLLSVATVSRGVDIMQCTLPEAMVIPDPSEINLSRLPDLSPFSAVAFGPGCGNSADTAALLKLLIQQSVSPLLIDADGLNILSENKTWLAFLPKGSILSPHVKEFERLSSPSSNAFNRLEKAREFSKRFALYVILKGAHTAICCPDGKVWFNSTGNPGMATAGSGDVLSGIILSFLAQGFHPKQAAIAGVYLHGLAGDLAKKTMPEACILASDIINQISDAYNLIKESH